MTDTPRSGRTSKSGSLRIGTLVGVNVYVSTTWFIIAAIFTVALGPAIEQARPGLGGMRFVAGFCFVVLFYLSVLLHEMSHAVAAKRFGIEVRSITLSFLGGATEIDGEAASPRQEFWIAFVGPVTSIAVGGALLPLLWVVPDGQELIRFAVIGIAATNIVVGVLNLAPGLPFDGGRVLRAAIWRATGDRNKATIWAGWTGRGLAVVVASAPLWLPAVGVGVSTVDLIILPVLAIFLWGASTASIKHGTFRANLPPLRARDLARRTLAVPPDLPLSDAIQRAQADQAGAIITLDASGRPAGIVAERAVQVVPESRRPWTTTGVVTRTLEPGLMLSPELTGDQLVLAMQRTPATEYLLVDPEGGILGVLSTADVDAAFAAARRTTA